MVTRIAKSKDYIEISNVIASSWKYAYRGIVNDDYLDSLKIDGWVDFLKTNVDNENIFVMILQDGQQIIGAAILGLEDINAVNLISFYLLPEKIGMGYGEIFYGSIEDEMKRRNLKKCIIHVLKENERAIRFYETQGFIDTNKIVIATLGDSKYPCKVYEKYFKV